MAMTAPLRPIALAALTTLPLWALPAPTAAAVVGEQRCVAGAVLDGGKGRTADMRLCGSLDNSFLTLSAPARCARSACDVTGTYRMTTRDGRPVASGKLATRTGYPGPGTYRVTVTARVRSAASGLDVRGTWTRTITFTWPKPEPVHTITVNPSVLHPGRTTTVTYTVTRRDLRGDSNARLGMIGEEGKGVRLSSSDRQCTNPLAGAYPSTERRPHVLDCALVDLQPGRPMEVKMRVRLGKDCSTVISKMGYWLPEGQATYNGGMLQGPTLKCEKS
ncbi:hypothetical protein [Streptomyces roseoverticillatus]|uniref:Secreted protein n=1 Tax=Streptomyces roseoverticillatus TaxID=66429 RepID=A0ABV3IWI1_9ACTN